MGRKAGKEDREARKRAMEDLDEFDMMTDEKNLNTSLSKKLGNTPDAILKGKSKSKTTNGTPKKKGEKKKNPWSDSDASDVEGSDLSDVLDDVPVAPREKAGGRRAAANIKFDKYKSDDEDSDDGSDEMFENSGVEEDDAKPKAKAKPKKEPKVEPKTYDIGSSDDEDSPVKKKPAPKKKQTSITDSFKPSAKVVEESDSDEASGYVANGKKNGVHTNGNGTKDSSKDEFDVSDSGSDFGGGFAKKMASKKPPPKKLGTSDDLFDSMMADEDKPAPPKKPQYSDDDDDSGSDFDSAPKTKKSSAPKKAASKKSYDSDDDYGSDFDEPKSKKAAPKKTAAPKAPKDAKPAPKKAAPKKKKGSGSEDDAPKPKKPKAAPKKKKNFDSDDMSGSDFDISNMEPARDRPGRGKKTVNYGGGNSGSGSDSDF